MHRLLNIILVAAIAVVAWRVYTTWSMDEPPLEEDSRGGKRPTADLPSTARTPPPPRLAMTIVERDLFDESRRAASSTPVEATPVPPPNVELIGVLHVGDEPEALIQEEGQSKPRHVFKGDDVGGYTVADIVATEIVLTSPSGEEVPLPLKLKLSATPNAGQSRRGGATPQAAQQPTAAGPSSPAPSRPANLQTTTSAPTSAASVRERLRELRRKRREQADRAR